MRFKVKFKKKSITYTVTIYEEDLEDLTWTPQEKRVMRGNDKTSFPSKLLESLLMKVRKYERTHKIKYSDNRRKKNGPKKRSHRLF